MIKQIQPIFENEIERLTGSKRKKSDEINAIHISEKENSIQIKSDQNAFGNSETSNNILNPNPLKFEIFRSLKGIKLNELMTKIEQKQMGELIKKSNAELFDKNFTSDNPIITRILEFYNQIHNKINSANEDFYKIINHNSAQKKIFNTTDKKENKEDHLN